jgi:hypothetical protein
MRLVGAAYKARPGAVSELNHTRFAVDESKCLIRQNADEELPQPQQTIEELKPLARRIAAYSVEQALRLPGTP